VKAEEWVQRFAAELGVPPPGEEEFARVLKLASVAAHSSERMAAPVACWLAGASGRPLSELVELAEGIDGPARDRRGS
jgi:hypothetical protein